MGEPIVPFVRQEGTYRQIGCDTGRAIQTTFTPPKAAARQIQLAAECERIVRDVHPRLLEQFDGLLDGGGFDRDDFAAYYFARERSVHRRRCTMFAIAPSHTADGRLLVGRNYDWVRADRDWCELREIRAEQTPPRVGYSNHWIGCPDVLTAHGLLLSLATLRPEPATAPGLQWNAIFDLVAATCTTAHQAADAIAGLPHFRPMNYLVADAAHAEVLEAAPRGVTRRGWNDGLLVATNRPVDGKHDADCRRYRGVVRLLRSHTQALDATAAKAVLRDHSVPICDGDHASTAPSNWETIWSFVCAPAAMAIELAPGRPCESEYVRIGFEKGKLESLAHMRGCADRPKDKAETR